VVAPVAGLAVVDLVVGRLLSAADLVVEADVEVVTAALAVVDWVAAGGPAAWIVVEAPAAAGCCSQGFAVVGLPEFAATGFTG
jgi:hypothetical protein